MGHIRFKLIFREDTMRLTRQTNYAMRILMYCAANTDRLSRIPEIAAAYSVSELFLFKILQPLVEAGLAVRPSRSACSMSCASPKRASPWPNASRTTPPNARWSTAAP
jgi:hypothetical protein